MGRAHSVAKKRKVSFEYISYMRRGEENVATMIPYSTGTLIMELLNLDNDEFTALPNYL